jgi:hypothetical protein
MWRRRFVFWNVMKELIFPGRAVLVGDAAADAVVDYSAVLTRMASADTIELRALDEKGRNVEVYYMLGSAAPVMAQTVESEQAEPDNAEAVRYMQAAIRRLDPNLVDSVYDEEADSADFRGHRSRSRDHGRPEVASDVRQAASGTSGSGADEADEHPSIDRHSDAERFGRSQ